MSLYAIGDIQGCFDELLALLDLIEFDPAEDELWFTGDLVNRGPKSLETLNFVRELGNSAITVLGNHDLHLIALSCGAKKRRPKDDCLAPILDAPNSDELIHWLRTRPILHEHTSLNYALVHAGISPEWNMNQARMYARELEQVLAGDDWQAFCHHMYGNEPNSWQEELNGMDRLRFITNVFTRMRYCGENGRLLLDSKVGPGDQPDGYHCWFDVRNHRTGDPTIIFGHWSTLGYINQSNVLSLDTGCLWGGTLTAAKLGADIERISYSCPGQMKPTPA